MEVSRTEDTRRNILEAARFLFQQQGYDQTTLQDIKARLGLSETTILAFFTSIDDLLEAVWSE